MAYYAQGNYEAVIIRHEVSTIGKNDTPYLGLWFVPGGDEYERMVRLWLTDKAIGNSVARLRSLGWEGDSFREDFGGGECPLKGVAVELRCSHRVDGDKTYEDWDFPGPPGGSSAEPAPVQEALLGKLDTLFGDELRKGAKAVHQKATSDDLGDDDIPF